MKTEDVRRLSSGCIHSGSFRSTPPQSLVATNDKSPAKSTSQRFLLRPAWLMTPFSDASQKRCENSGQRRFYEALLTGHIH